MRRRNGLSNQSDALRTNEKLKARASDCFAAISRPRLSVISKKNFRPEIVACAQIARLGLGLELAQAHVLDHALTQG